MHRDLKQTPRAAFGNQISARRVALQRLREAFLVETTLTAHPKTGEVRVDGIQSLQESRACASCLLRKSCTRR